jgi:hypothetical protein
MHNVFAAQGLLQVFSAAVSNDLALIDNDNPIAGCLGFTQKG